MSAMLDERIRFSEDYYASKEEVEQAYNTNLIDSIWDRIVKYRALFSIDLSLRSIDKSPFMLTLTKTLQNRIATCERKLLKIYLKYEKLNQSKKQSFDETISLNFFNSFSLDEQDFSKDMLLHIIRGDISTFPSKAYPLYYYSSTWKNYKEHCYDNIDTNLLNRIHRRVCGLDENEEELQIRKEEIDTPHYFQSDYIYKAAPIEELTRLIDELLEFCKNDSISPLLKSIISIFYIKYIKPFDYCNEEVASLLSRLILAKDDFDKASFFINFEEIAFDNSQHATDLIKYVQKTSDVTYFVMNYLNFIEDDINYTLGLLEENEGQMVEEEQHVYEEVEFERPNLKQIDELKYHNYQANQSSLPSDLQGKSAVALPIFPSGVDSSAIEGIVENLLEVYPYLKKNQAHFYATHCTIGKHYTIAQYKKEEKVAYETARTSMDFLAEQGFYNKTSVRNKFVYTPIPRH